MNRLVKIHRAILVASVLVISGCKLHSTTKDTDPEGSTLTDGLESTEHRLFVTSVTYTLNLGGLTGADAKCMTRAAAAGLTRTYKAILSSSTVDAKDRLTITGAVWNFITASTKQSLAANLAGFWNRPPADILPGYDELYVDQSSSPAKVITHTNNDGTRFSSNIADTCSDWTTAVGVDAAALGVPFYGDVWLSEDSGHGCNVAQHLYCISQ